MQLFKIILFVSILAGSRAFAGDLDLLYCQTAEAIIPPAMTALSGEIAALDSSIAPEETKRLRKSIVKVRDYLDLYVFCYPVGDDDQWREIRESLDEGYEKVGKFKDLFDSQVAIGNEDPDYDSKDLDKRRKKVLDWAKSVVELSDVWLNYLRAPQKAGLATRKDKHMPQFYWGAVDLKPDPALTSGENLSALLSALAKQGNQEYRAVIKIEKLLKKAEPSGDAAVRFHSFRKQMRSLVKVAGYFPELVTGATSKAALEVISDLVDRYGKINDLIVAYDAAIESDKAKKANKIRKEVEDEWSQLVEWQKRSKIDDVLELLSHSLK